jgi:RNA polymerase sigma-70 factor (ECF subfamily)
MTTDKATFLKLIQEHKGIIVKISNSYCSDKSDRDDLAQEIVFNLWKSFKNYKADYKFSTWMYRVALNVAISFYRKEKRALPFTSYSDNLMVYADDSEVPEEMDAKITQLQNLMKELKELDKSLLLLYLEGKSYTEIAEIIGLSESNVGTKLNRLKAYLKSKFSNQ